MPFIILLFLTVSVHVQLLFPGYMLQLFSVVNICLIRPQRFLRVDADSPSSSREARYSIILSPAILLDNTPPNSFDTNRDTAILLRSSIILNRMIRSASSTSGSATELIAGLAISLSRTTEQTSLRQWNYIGCQLAL